MNRSQWSPMTMAAARSAAAARYLMPTILAYALRERVI